MNNISRTITITGVALLLLWQYPLSVTACQCLQIRTLDRELDESEVIFAGETTEVDSYRPTGAATFEVISVWRGSLPAKIKISNSVGCDSVFRVGEVYLVFARTISHHSEFDYQIGAFGCGQTGPLEFAKEALARLGEGSPPQKPNPSFLWVVVIGIVLLLLIGTTLIVLRRRWIATI